MCLKVGSVFVIVVTRGTLLRPAIPKLVGPFPGSRGHYYSL
jgi:hypothetical protein